MVVPLLPSDEVIVVQAHSFNAINLKETENVLAVKMLGNHQDPFIRLTPPGHKPLQTKVVSSSSSSKRSRWRKEGRAVL